ncbi:Protein Wnt [Meloidogyne graminicola]|uniref:Protein Wnt n=1 Tax=Meloidogyne graminicola TaxID=189291 RepID=A0A8S9ZQN2_9BILA|nr:Protein Wnt [Meloidogyne graminicola]
MFFINYTFQFSQFKELIKFQQQHPLQTEKYLNNYYKPEKLFKGCPRELTQINTFRQFPLLCKTQPSLAIIAYEGILDAMDECRQQMKFERWDCSHSGTILHEPTITKHTLPESAYLWAISAAGVAWGIATACAQGWLDECRCVNNFNELKSSISTQISEWNWGGCSYGIHYGVITSRKLLTRTINVHNGKTNSNLQLLRNLEKHNLKVGRMAVRRTLTSSCTCHGVSGSCQQKTCWKKTADLKYIAKHLKHKYRNAKLATFLPNGQINALNSELVYSEKGINICSQFHYDHQRKRSLPRICSWRNATYTEGDCTNLCCGKGYTVTHQVVPYKCNCKFIWCCRVECKECLEHRWVSTCNV